MKIRIQNYTFDKTARTVTFKDYVAISLENILLITNVTSNVIIYNFAVPALGGIVNSNILTLDTDTSAMANTDGLQIFYDDPQQNPASDESIKLLSRLVKLMESSAVVDSSMRQRIAIEYIAGTTLGASVTGLSSGAGAPSTNYPTASAPIQSPGTSYWQPVWIGPVDQRYQIMDNARLVYGAGIRNNLIFT